MLRIAKDDSRTQLILLWNGPPNRIMLRILVLSVISPLIILPFFSFVFHFPDFDLELFLPTFFGTSIFLLFTAFTSYCRGFGLDRHTAVLSINNSFLPFLPRKTTIPFDTIQKIGMIMGPEAENMKVTMHLRFNTPTQTYPKNLYIPLSVENLDQRSKGMDLLFRMGRILDWEGYTIPRNDPREMDVDLSRTIKGDNVVAIPLASLSVQVPELQIEPFDPQRFKAKGAQPQIEWNPGTTIKIKYPRPSMLQSIVPAMNSLIAATVGTYLVAYFAQQPNAIKAGAAIGCGVLFFLIILAYQFWKNSSHEIVFDWNQQTATFQAYGKKRVVPFKEFQEIVIRGKSYSLGGHGHRRNYYWCEIVAIVPGTDEIISITDSFLNDSETPYKMALSLTAELSRAISVPWKWIEYS
jgi:hypothetical protein